MDGSGLYGDRVSAGRGRLRLGVIGAGRWGRKIIRTLNRMPEVRVSLVASRNPATRDLVDASCVIETDWRRLLRHRDLDAVVVAAPPAVHAEITAETVEAGLPVFVEKPLTCDVREAERLFDLVSGKGGYVLVDHVHLFSHAYQALKARLPGIGPIIRVRADAGAWGPFRTDTPVLWDWGPHDAAFCVDLLGVHPRTLSAERVERRPIDGTWGEALLLYAGYPNGVTVDIRLSNLRQRKCRSLRVEGAGGTLLYDDCAERKLVYRPAEPAGAAPEAIVVADEPALDCALSHFLGNVSTGNTSLDDLRSGVDVVRMLDSWDAYMCRGGA